MNKRLPPETRTELLLDAMSLDQKIEQIGDPPNLNEELEGCGFTPLGRHIEGIAELAIPTYRAINGGDRREGRRLPPGANRDRACRAPRSVPRRSAGRSISRGVQVLGQEARDFAHHVLLGPGLNLIRHPYTGRGQEYMWEDPYLGWGDRELSRLKESSRAGPTR